MLVRSTFIDPSYWTVNAGNLQNNNLLTQTTVAFIIDPVVITDVLGGSKTTKFTPEQIDANFKKTLVETISIPNASNFLTSSFEARGWTTNNKTTLITELAQFIWNNLHNTTNNPILNDVDLVIGIGDIQGSNYILPFGYFGDQGTVITILDDIYGDMLFTDNTYEFLYGNSLFTDTSFDLTIDGGTW